MISFIVKYIATIILLISVLLGSFDVGFLEKPISNYINIQLILIFAFKISNPNLNFGRGIYLFFISIVNDSLNGLVFGTSAILYFIVFAVAAFQSSIKLRSIFISEWIAFTVSLLIAYIVFFGLINLSGENIVVFNIFMNFAFTIIGYPILYFTIARTLFK